VPIRLIAAYALILCLLAAFSSLIAWKIYHSRRRTYLREKRRRLAAEVHVDRPPAE